MPTISFDRDVVLNEQASDKLLRMLSEERKDKIEIEDINVEEKLARGKELLDFFNQEEDMKKIIDFTTYSQKLKTQIESYSLLDMIIDSKKRKEVYDYYDRNYQSTQEEDEICNEMRGKYRE